MIKLIKYLLEVTEICTHLKYTAYMDIKHIHKNKRIKYTLRTVTSGEKNSVKSSKIKYN